MSINRPLSGFSESASNSICSEAIESQCSQASFTEQNYLSCKTIINRSEMSDNGRLELIGRVFQSILSSELSVFETANDLVRSLPEEIQSRAELALFSAVENVALIDRDVVEVTHKLSESLDGQVKLFAQKFILFATCRLEEIHEYDQDLFIDLSKGMPNFSKNLLNAALKRGAGNGFVLAKALLDEVESDDIRHQLVRDCIDLLYDQDPGSAVVFARSGFGEEALDSEAILHLFFRFVESENVRAAFLLIDEIKEVNRKASAALSLIDFCWDLDQHAQALEIALDKLPEYSFEQPIYHVLEFLADLIRTTNDELEAKEYLSVIFKLLNKMQLETCQKESMDRVLSKIGSEGVENWLPLIASLGGELSNNKTQLYLINQLIRHVRWTEQELHVERHDILAPLYVMSEEIRNQMIEPRNYLIPAWYD